MRTTTAYSDAFHPGPARAFGTRNCVFDDDALIRRNPNATGSPILGSGAFQYFRRIDNRGELLVQIAESRRMDGFSETQCTIQGRAKLAVAARQSPSLSVRR